MCRVSARRLFIYNFVWGLLKSIFMGATRRSLQAQPKILKNYHNTKSTNQDEIKKEKEPKIRIGATRENLQARSKILKKSSNHQIYQSEQKFSQKNYVLYLKSVKEPKIRMGATRRNLQAQPNPNQPIRTNIFQKKLCFVVQQIWYTFAVF
jgi:hypothetical protein